MKDNIYGRFLLDWLIVMGWFGLVLIFITEFILNIKGWIIFSPLFLGIVITHLVYIYFEHKIFLPSKGEIFERFKNKLKKERKQLQKKKESKKQPIEINNRSSYIMVIIFTVCVGTNVLLKLYRSVPLGMFIFTCVALCFALFIIFILYKSMEGD